MSPGLWNFRRANAQLQAALKYGSGPWEVDLLDSNTPIRANDPNSNPAPPTPPASTPWDEIEDVFSTSPTRNKRSNALSDEQVYPLPASPEFGESRLAEKHESLDLSTNNTSPNRRLSPRSPVFPFRTPTRTVSIIHPQGTPSSLRDPRHLFGSEETHLPWIKRLSPKHFKQQVTPRMLSPGSPPAKSIWEAEDDEFDRWPTVAQARAELDAVRQKATIKRNTFVKPEKPGLSVAEQIEEAMGTPMGVAVRTVNEQEQLILELEDMDCGNPWGRDAHDDIIGLFRSKRYDKLPADAPARHMHVLNATSYISNSDPVAKAARPRLCDAVATVLAYTSLECLEAFLDPKVEVFEWRRLGNCVMIRREGREVVVGNYYNFGTTYQWGYLVRSTIDADGAWSETYASASQGTTPVTKERVLLEEFDTGVINCDVEPDNEEFALYVGRELARFLLHWSVWDYSRWWRYKVEWEVDGKVTNARDHGRYPAGLLE
ncbi:hypothetical protein EJ07DRAFT_151019 [Lizonia empirigonia]|nr:hypothetical protein EJ07DRAFT_151019 [Lizonia empirigonia]